MPKTTALIDVIGAGYRILNRHLWVLLLPLALDLYLWLGVPVVLTPLLTPLFDDVREQVATLAADAPPEQFDAWQQVGDTLLAVQNGDVRGLLIQLNWMPTLLTDRVGGGGADEGYVIGSFAGGLALIVGLNVLALALSGLFLTPLGWAVRGVPLTAKGWGSGALQIGWGVLCYLALIIGAALTIGLPFLVLVGLLAAAVPGAAVAAVLVLGFVTQLLAYIIYIYAGFAIEAMLIEQVGPFTAIGRSVQMVRRNFWATLGLLVVALVIGQGMLVVWRQLTTPGGVLLASLGSAYVGGGLAAARLIFYQQRAASPERGS